MKNILYLGGLFLGVLGLVAAPSAAQAQFGGLPSGTAASEIEIEGENLEQPDVRIPAMQFNTETGALTVRVHNRGGDTTGRSVDVNVWWYDQENEIIHSDQGLIETLAAGAQGSVEFDLPSQSAVVAYVSIDQADRITEGVESNNTATLGRRLPDMRVSRINTDPFSRITTVRLINSGDAHAAFDAFQVRYEWLDAANNTAGTAVDVNIPEVGYFRSSQMYDLVLDQTPPVNAVAIRITIDPAAEGQFGEILEKDESNNVDERALPSTTLLPDLRVMGVEYTHFSGTDYRPLILIKNQGYVAASNVHVMHEWLDQNGTVLRGQGTRIPVIEADSFKRVDNTLRPYRLEGLEPGQVPVKLRITIDRDGEIEEAIEQNNMVESWFMPNYAIYPAHTAYSEETGEMEVRLYNRGNSSGKTSGYLMKVYWYDGSDNEIGTDESLDVSILNHNASRVHKWAIEKPQGAVRYKVVFDEGNTIPELNEEDNMVEEYLDGHEAESGSDDGESVLGNTMRRIGATRRLRTRSRSLDRVRTRRISAERRTLEGGEGNTPQRRSIRTRRTRTSVRTRTRRTRTSIRTRTTRTRVSIRRTKRTPRTTRTRASRKRLRVNKPRPATNNTVPPPLRDLNEGTNRQATPQATVNREDTFQIDDITLLQERLRLQQQLGKNLTLDEVREMLIKSKKEQAERLEEVGEKVNADPDSFVCIQIELPVCGRDGKTYKNSCYADKAGAIMKHEGACTE